VATSVTFDGARPDARRPAAEKAGGASYGGARQGDDGCANAIKKKNA
jgi:hypothetical protein